MNNFPIFNNDFDLNKDDILKYISLFKNHKVLIKSSTDFLITLHKYPDGLSLQIFWKIHQFPDFLKSFTINVEDLLSLHEKNHIEMSHFKHHLFSISPKEISKETREIFNSIISSKNRKFSKEKYYELEFNTPSLTLDEDFFNELLNYINNYSLFEKHLKNQKNNGFN